MIAPGTAVTLADSIPRFGGVDGVVRHRVCGVDESDGAVQDYYVVDVPGAPAGKVHAFEAELKPVTELSPEPTWMKPVRDAAIREAKARGYESDICSTCQNMTMTRNGPCLKCETCGTTTGCG